jgi:hypothetical protein
MTITTLQNKDILFWILIVVSFLCNIITLHQGHNWGDDFAQYLIYARNISQGFPVTDNIMMDKIIINPPGYGFLLAPFIKFASLNWILLKFLNIFFWAVTVVGVGLTLKLLHGHISRLAILFLCFSSYFFTLKQNLLSEFPFVVFFVWAIYFFERFNRSSKGMEWILFLFFSFCALLTRSTGVALYLAAAFYLLVKGAESQRLWLWLWLLISFFASLLVQSVTTGFSMGNISALSHDWSVLYHSMVQGVPIVLRGFLCTIVPWDTVLTLQIDKIIRPYALVFSLLLIALITVSFAIRTFRKSVTAIDCAAFFYFLLVTTISVFPQPPYVFSRFLFPILPVALIYLVSLTEHFDFSMMKRGIAVSSQRILFTSIILLNICNISAIFRFNDDALLKKPTQEMFSWVRMNVKNDEVVMFNKPRALALMTGVRTVSVSLGELGRTRNNLIRFHPDYLLVFSNPADQFNNAFNQIGYQLVLLWKNEKFKIFNILSKE